MTIIRPALLAFATAFTLAACTQETPQATVEPDDVPVPLPEVEDAQAVEIAQQDELAEFKFAYPAEAAAIPRLKQDLDDKLAAAREEIRAMAQSEKEMREEMGGTFNGLFSQTRYTTLGDGERLLSLLGEISTYTGGAHPNSGSVTLLWDRILEKPIDSAVLLGGADSRDTALRPAFCEKLAAEQLKRRGMLIDGMFGECPDLDQITIVPTDEDGDGKFDALLMVADAYVAGPYAEGDYRITVPVTPTVRGAIAEDYRADFTQ